MSAYLESIQGDVDFYTEKIREKVGKAQEALGTVIKGTAAPIIYADRIERAMMELLFALTEAGELRQLLIRQRVSAMLSAQEVQDASTAE